MALMLGMLRSATSGQIPGILSAGSGAGTSGAGKGGEDAPGAEGDDMDGGDAAGERKDADSAKDNDDGGNGGGVDGLQGLMDGDGAPAPCEQEDVRDAEESRAPETEHVREEAPATAVNLPADPARGGIAATAETLPATVPLEASDASDALDEVENDGDNSDSDSNEDAAESCAKGKEGESPGAPGSEMSLIDWAVQRRENADARTAAEAAVKSLQTSKPSGGRGRGGGKSSKEKVAAVKAKAKAKTKEPKAKAATAKVKAAAKRNAKGEPKRKGKTDVADAPWLSHRCDVMCDHADSMLLSMLSCIRGTVDKHYQ